MSVSDPIADMLTRIRNATMAGLETVDIPHSIIKSELARILKEEGYINQVAEDASGSFKVLRVTLKYKANKDPVIQGLRRISKSGLRRYTTVDDIPRVLGGMGIAVLSTSKGIMTGKQARQTRVGGELLCYVW